MHFLIDCIVDQPAIISNKMLFINRTSLLGWHHSWNVSGNLVELTDVLSKLSLGLAYNPCLLAVSLVVINSSVYY